MAESTFIEDFCLFRTIPRAGEDYWQYLSRARQAETFGVAGLSIGVQNTWIYHPDSPHNRVYEATA